MLTCTFELTAQERVIHGKPAAEAVREEIERIRARRVLLLTTRSLAEGRLVREVSSALGDRCVGKFSAISAHSPREAVIAGAAIARETDADHLLAVGGGSVVDATKTMQIALWRGVRDVDALSALAVKRGTAPLSPLDGDRIRMTAVTTTLSAAEFTAGAGITDVQRKVKMHFRHPWMVPRTVILDPAATLETPMELFLSTGMRAMDHAVERWCSIQPHPVAEGLALQAMGMLAASMPAVKARPEDLEPRLNCQLGAWLTMIAPAALVSERCEPRHRLHTRRLCGRAARYHLVHLARCCAAMERARQCRAPEGRGREAGPTRRASLRRDAGFRQVAGSAHPAHRRRDRRGQDPGAGAAVRRHRADIDQSTPGAGRGRSRGNPQARGLEVA
jgi:alcohol dehydrogenase class IV